MSETATQRQYKATFILDLRGYQEPVETLMDKIKQTVESAEGSVDSVKNLGQKDFIRVTDRNRPNGIYIEVEFSGPSSAPETIQDKFRLDKTVDRILIQSSN